MKSRTLLRPATLVALALLCLPAMAGAAATITIVPGAGFTDPTPVAPVGGNPGTTIGEQRLFAFQEAADIWGSTLTSTVEIFVQASFQPLSCTPTGGILGAAGTIQVVANFPGAPMTDTWYPVALGNKLAGFDLIPGPTGTNADDIGATFNASIDNNPNCLAGTNWYYGFDHNPPGTDIDFLVVVLHELDHGLGFASFTNESTGQYLGPPFFPSIFDKFIFDNTLGLTWNQMTAAQRAASAINCKQVSWSGANVTTFAPFFLDPGVPELTVESPPAIAGGYDVGAAQFGPPLGSPGVNGDLELVDDGVGTATDGCEPLVGFTAGLVALIDRGSCPFVQKVQNAEAAGAIAVVIADNAAGCPPAPLGGTAATTIPAGRITLDDGNLIKNQLLTDTVNVTLGVDLSQLAGTDENGQVLLYTPDPVAPGSSVSHWDTSAFPDLLMEPSINDGLDSSLDLSVAQAADIGWMLEQTCGNGVREGLEFCDGADLFGQTCESLGFDPGTLGCTASCDFDTSGCGSVCDGGKSDGRWNLPDLTHLGTVSGVLRDGSGTVIFKMLASLVQTSLDGGQINGFIYDGAFPNPYYIDGVWEFTTADKGTFWSRIFEFGTGNAVGGIRGTWDDNPAFTVGGKFEAEWEICP